MWKAWTDKELVKKWWGPRGVTNPVCEWEPKPNGKIYIVMKAGKELGDFAGQEWPMKGKFVDVVPKSRLSFITMAIDESQDIFIEGDVVIELRSMGDKTKMEMRSAFRIAKAGQQATGALQGAEMGWNQQMDKLVELVNAM